MQTVRLSYGDADVDAQLPDNALVVRPGSLAPEPLGLEDPWASTRDAVRQPLGIEPLGTLVGPGSRVTIAFPDRVKGGSHETAHRKVAISVVLDELETAGVSARDIRLICAIGLHRKNRLEEFRSYLGEEVTSRVGIDTIANHDAEDPDGIVSLQDSDLGDCVAVNRDVLESDLTVLIGHTAGNPYGGFSGGYKMPATGLTTWRSIRSHHTPHSMHRADFVPVSTRSHFRKQLASIGRQIEARLPRPFFAVDAVLNSRSEQTAVFAGTIPRVEEASWPHAQRRTELETPGRPADVLVVGVPRTFHYGPAMGSNPILMMQAIGSSYARSAGALRPYPVVIAAAVCDGWFNDAEFPAYSAAYELLQRRARASAMTADEESFCTNPDYVYSYRFNHSYHPFHAFSMIYMGALLRERTSAVYIAGAKEPGYARGMGAIPTESIAEALEEAVRFVGREPKIIVIPDLRLAGYHLTASNTL